MLTANICLFPSDGMPVEINRIEVATGRRQFVCKIAPKDLAGVWGVVWPVLIMPNGKSYVYFRLSDFLRFVSCKRIAIEIMTSWSCGHSWQLGDFSGAQRTQKHHYLAMERAALAANSGYVMPEPARRGQ